jgi:plasmid stabilization system protein ParE
MSDYQVRILRTAALDIEEIASWISKRSSDGSARWMAAFERLLANLCTSPESFSLSPEAGFPGSMTNEVRERGLMFKPRMDASNVVDGPICTQFASTQ